MPKRLSNRERALRAVSEKDFQKWLTDLLTATGWRWYHAADNLPRMDGRGKMFVQNINGGFPDLVAVRGSRLLFIEVKREKGEVRQNQIDWGLDLAKTPVEYYLWRPSDREFIKTVLVRKWSAKP